MRSDGGLQYLELGGSVVMGDDAGERGELLEIKFLFFLGGNQGGTSFHGLLSLNYKF